MKIAIEGCAHGELDNIYDTIKSLEEAQGFKIDLLLCCGDFQSTRNEQDLKCMAIPQKYLSMCTFYKYYSGEKQAPCLTIFIGGNHEASNYLQELPFGGWVAPNIYYLGHAGVVNVNGLRIGGLSGIFKKMDYFKGRFEKSPYDPQTLRSVYHVRNIDIFRLKQLSGKIDIIMSHDWPANVSKHGNEKQLINFKPYFQNDIQQGKLGNPFTEELLYALKPQYWFSGHLHCKFAALIEHEDKTITKFLALDKCLPQRRFLQIIDIHTLNDLDDSSKEKSSPLKFEYDLEWLSILNLTNHLVNIKRLNSYMPTKHCINERSNFTPSDEEKQNILSSISNSLTIPLNFIKTVTEYDPSNPNNSKHKPMAALNPQTIELCSKLKIDDPIRLILDSSCMDDNLDTSTFTPSELNVSTPVKRVSWPLNLPNPIKGTCNKTEDTDQSDIEGFNAVDASLADIISKSIKRINSTSGLPEPKNCGYTDDLYKQIEEKNEVVDSEILFITDTTGSLSSQNNKKKFKRRNMNIYKDDD